ncbi:nascent polypeptide-associated complex protein [Candidatus Woesearchaeota archaeon]|nr:nascent polypeptide-associated complex protein [Candidatus Woesearchaeota archaeon]
MFPGVNPRQMQQMMRKMGIQQVEIPATKVSIQCADREIIINNPQVTKVNLMGQETFQIVGEVEEKKLSATPEIFEEDIKMVMEQAQVGRTEAERAIKEANGDLAEAILKLNS